MTSMNNNNNGNYGPQINETNNDVFNLTETNTNANAISGGSGHNNKGGIY